MPLGTVGEAVPPASCGSLIRLMASPLPDLGFPAGTGQGSGVLLPHLLRVPSQDSKGSFTLEAGCVVGNEAIIGELSTPPLVPPFFFPNLWKMLPPSLSSQAHPLPPSGSLPGGADPSLVDSQSAGEHPPCTKATLGILGETQKDPSPAAQVSVSINWGDRKSRPPTQGGVVWPVFWELGGMGLKMGTASRMEASGKACWRRWLLQIGLDEEGPISLGGYVLHTNLKPP